MEVGKLYIFKEGATINEPAPRVCLGVSGGYCWMTKVGATPHPATYKTDQWIELEEQVIVGQEYESSGDAKIKITAVPLCVDGGMVFYKWSHTEDFGRDVNSYFGHREVASKERFLKHYHIKGA